MWQNGVGGIFSFTRGCAKVLAILLIPCFGTWASGSSLWFLLSAGISRGACLTPGKGKKFLFPCSSANAVPILGLDAAQPSQPVCSGASDDCVFRLSILVMACNLYWGFPAEICF